MVRKGGAAAYSAEWAPPRLGSADVAAYPNVSACTEELPTRTYLRTRLHAMTVHTVSVAQPNLPCDDSAYRQCCTT